MVTADRRSTISRRETVRETRNTLLTVPEVARRLRVSRQSVYRRIASGELPAVQLGGPGTPLRVDERELEAWVYGTPAGSFSSFLPEPEDPAERGDPRETVDSPPLAGGEE